MKPDVPATDQSVEGFNGLDPSGAGPGLSGSEASDPELYGSQRSDFGTLSVEGPVAPAPSTALHGATATDVDDKAGVVGAPMQTQPQHGGSHQRNTEHTAGDVETGAPKMGDPKAGAHKTGSHKTGAHKTGAHKTGAHKTGSHNTTSRSKRGHHPPKPANSGHAHRRSGSGHPAFAALDLGTNNCRLLVAHRDQGGFRVRDAFSRIVRLGEGLGDHGALSGPAMDRALEALKICASKLRQHNITRARCVATQACRSAINGGEFIDRVRDQTGIVLEVIDPEEEARLAVMGCLDLMDLNANAALVIDIGGGSTELSWVDLAAMRSQSARERLMNPPILAWASFDIGVVSLAEALPETPDRDAWYADMVANARAKMRWPAGAQTLGDIFAAGEGHIVGTSGAVTSLAGVHLDLPRYQRDRVDGLWMSQGEAHAARDHLLAMSLANRARHPCIGPDRADLVLAGAAILDAVLGDWPCQRLRVADRGVREGLLMSLIHANRRRRRRRRRTKSGRSTG